MKSLFSPQDIVRSGMCIGCGSCVTQSAAAGIDAQMRFDPLGQLKPNGPPDWVSQASEAFTASCPFSPRAANEDQLAAVLFSDAATSPIGRFLANYVGHVAEGDFRMEGSSGGMVSWVATELLRAGLIDGVAHVVATNDPQGEGRYFRYRISRSEAEIREGAKSRYYPVELSEILNPIRQIPGRYAVVAIPCMIKAIQLLRREDRVYRERIQFTLGLFCGHMKSARFVESFAWQMGVPINEVKQVEFRQKDPDRPANWYNAMLELKDGRKVNRDWWHLADGDWGAGFFMNSACSFCDDVIAETADISFGDAWVEPYASDGKGSNVVVIRSRVIEKMVAAAIGAGRLNLESVNTELVARTQAAGLRQRREGLAYRLTWARSGVRSIKRVAPDASRQTWRRKVIYRLRHQISVWSHRMFWLARTLRSPQLYLFWARTVVSIYHGVAYHNGKLSEMRKRFSDLKR